MNSLFTVYVCPFFSFFLLLHCFADFLLSIPVPFFFSLLFGFSLKKGKPRNQSKAQAVFLSPTTTCDFDLAGVNCVFLAFELLCILISYSSVWNKGFYQKAFGYLLPLHLPQSEIEQQISTFV